jgi:hypothetical protein
MPAAIVADGADRFLRAEAGPLDLASTGGPGEGRPGEGRPGEGRPGEGVPGEGGHSGLALAGVVIAGIGTTAPKAVRGALLAEALEALGYRVASATAHGSPAELMADRSWQLGVVLSPWKRDVGAHCDRLAPSAARTGVVDTVLRTPAGTVGFNTNTWASLSALELLFGGDRAPRHPHPRFGGLGPLAGPRRATGLTGLPHHRQCPLGRGGPGPGPTVPRRDSRRGRWRRRPGGPGP